ncbi:MAG TPA: serine hydrolase [Acidimicrobiales bacterium]|nr:serine hydrolase [Acidimicrobiales bacterium]
MRIRVVITVVVVFAVLGFRAAAGSTAEPTSVASQADLELLASIDEPFVDRAVAQPAEAALEVEAASSPPADAVTLSQALAAVGVGLPDGTSVYASTSSDTYEAGGGALGSDFWPASSVKVLAAIGALEYLHGLGFSGAATVTMGDETFVVADVYRAAITESDNAAYDRLVRIAGLDWLNTVFLTAANGFPESVIQRAYSGMGVWWSPTMTITEGARSRVMPERQAGGTYACPDDGNCSNLLELTDSVRRVVLDAEIPDAERFDLAPSDVAALTDALLDAESFVGPAATRALGHDAVVFAKPGYVPGNACVDAAVIVDTDTGRRYVLGVTTPDDGSTCPDLVEIAAATLDFLQARTA